MPALTIPPPAAPSQAVSDRYRLMICTRHGWSQSRQRFPSHQLARQAGLWHLSHAGVITVQVIDTLAATGTSVIQELTKHTPRKPR